jgi:hypothetical protein
MFVNATGSCEWAKFTGSEVQGFRGGLSHVCHFFRLEDAEIFSKVQVQVKLKARIATTTKNANIIANVPGQSYSKTRQGRSHCQSRLDSQGALVISLPSMGQEFFLCLSSSSLCSRRESSNPPRKPLYANFYLISSSRFD